MARDLFASAASNDRRHVGQWYTVPCSIAAHAIVLAACVIVPLVASGALPTPASVMIFTAPPPPPVAVPPPAVLSSPPRIAPPDPRPDLAPTEAPVAITPEPPPQLPHLVDRLSDNFAAGKSVASLSGPPAAPAPPAPSGPVRPGGNLQPPRRVAGAMPVYPAIAKAAHVQGTVVVEATIARDGTVKDARVVVSIPLLDEAALAAVRQWRYTPSTLNQQPVEVLLDVSVNFGLQ